jgi:hypothetical protein
MPRPCLACAASILDFVTHLACMPLEKGKTACSDSSATDTPIWFGYCILLAKATASLLLVYR